MTDWYVPKVVYQLDGSSCQGSACWAASGAVMLDGATTGASIITPTVFRQRAGGGSGSSDNKACPSGFEVDIVAGLAKMGVSSSIAKVRRNDAGIRLRNPRAALFAVATDYELWPAALKGAAPGFDGNHMIVAIPGADDKGRVAVANPLARTYQRVPLPTLLDAAQKFSRERGRGGMVWLVRVYRKPIAGTDQPPADATIDAQTREIEMLRDALDDAHDDVAELAVQLRRFDKADAI